MQTEKDTSPCEIPEGVYKTGSDFLVKTLPLLDNAYKRWAFDLYATQLSNAKNVLVGVICHNVGLRSIL